MYSNNETSILRHLMRPENMTDLEVVGLQSASIHTSICMITAPNQMVRLERMSDYRSVGLERFHYMYICIYACIHDFRKSLH